MSPSVVSPAVTPAKTAATAPVKCLMLFVHPAAHPAEFPSSREMTALFIAAIALLKTDNQMNMKSTPSGVFFILLVPRRQTW